MTDVFSSRTLKRSVSALLAIRSEIFLLAVVASTAMVNIWWVVRYRIGQPLDIDEAGYISISLADFQSLVHSGPLAWIRTIEQPSSVGPLMTAISSLFYVVLTSSELSALLTSTFFYIVTVVASFRIALRISNRNTANVSAIAVAVCPVIVNYSREYNFAIAACAVMALAVMFLLECDSFANRRLAIAFGITSGLLPLARTMTLAFLPGLVASAVQQCLSRKLTRKTVMTFTLSLTCGVAACESWLFTHFTDVFSYLTSFGYGSRSVEFGSQQSVWSLDSWNATLQQIQLVYAPDFVFLLLGVVAGCAVFVMRALAFGFSNASSEFVCGKSFAVFITIAEGLIALTSSGNKGSGFIAPLIPLMLVLASVSITRLFRDSAFVSGLLITVGIVLYIPLTSLDAPLADRQAVTLPFFGGVMATYGRGEIQSYENGGGYDDTPNEPVTHDHGSAWIKTIDDLAVYLHDGTASGTPIAVGFRHAILNVNTVGLSQMRAYGFHSDFRMITPIVSGDTVSGYKDWLSRGDAAESCLLVTATGSLGEFNPKVSSEFVETAARELDFKPVQRLTLPDARLMTIWRRAPTCHV